MDEVQVDIEQIWIGLRPVHNVVCPYLREKRLRHDRYGSEPRAR